MVGTETYVSPDGSFSTTDFSKALVRGFMISNDYGDPLAQMRRLYRVIGILGEFASEECRARIMHEMDMKVEWR